MSPSKRLALAATLTLALSQNAFATWYTATVDSISARGEGVERLYIRVFPTGQTAAPNPANCPGSFAGAAWILDASTSSSKLAAAVALSAKTSGATVNVEISDTDCYIGNPVMTWITIL